MPDVINNSLEQGGNSVGISLTGLDTVRQALAALSLKVSATLMEQALDAAARVYQSAIESATPTGSGQYTYVYQGKSGPRTVTVKHSPGKARGSVIIYNRKAAKGLLSNEATPRLVGYEKRQAYYMYWYEYGSRHQSPRAFFRSTVDATEGSAIAAAEDVLRAGIGA